MSKSEIFLVVSDRYATVSLAALERQKGCKALLPAIVSPTPNKPYCVEALLAFYG
jgi:hypothetical protein